MLKQVKNSLILCLIALQFVAPFVHAHAFGHDSFKAQVMHMHADEFENVKSADGANSTLNQTHIGENELIGAVTTVASGIKASLTDDIADGLAAMAIFFTFALLIFNAPTRFLANSTQDLPLQRNFYSLQSPRAPPR
jgi:hypothetical protein